MLRSQVEAIDLNRPRATRVAAEERAVQVNRSYRPMALLVWSLLVALSVLISAPPLPAQPKGRRKKAQATTSTSASPTEQSLTNIPLPIGHEAKGLVLPDFDGEGHLRGRFEAGTAHRIDEEHIGFEHLKITTYTPENQPDLRIDMHTSVLDLKTRVLSSQERTTIQRSDFNIAGDSVYFDTNTRTGRLIGNVKMVITDESHLTAKPNSSE
jgi:hypothetical protein